MAIPAAEIVSFTITLSPSSGPKFGFGSLLGVFNHDIVLERKSGPYRSIREVVAAGFTSTAAPNVYAWANTVFSQTDNVEKILIGRRVPSTGGPAGQVWQVDVSGAPDFVDETSDFNDGDAGDWAVFPTTEGVGDYAAIGSIEPFSKVTLDSTGGTTGTDGVVVWEYWDGSTWTALSDVVDGTSGFTAALGSGQVVSWTLPTDWAKTSLDTEDPMYYVRARVTTVYTVNPLYTSGTVGGDATLTATLDALEEARGVDWYITNVESRSTTDILAAAAWHESRRKIFLAQSSQAGILTNAPGNLASVLKGLAYNRTSLLYHALDAEYADGAVSSVGGGYNLDGINGAAIWSLLQVAGLTVNDLSPLAWSNIRSANAGGVGTSAGRDFFWGGRMASARPIDTQTTIDWLGTRLEELYLDFFIQNKKVPYTDPGIASSVAVGQGLLDSGVSFGHFSGNPAPVVTGPIEADVSDEDKNLRRLRLTATATLAGAIESIFDFAINLSE